MRAVRSLLGSTVGTTILCMGVAKRSVSIDAEVAERVEQAAAEDGIAEWEAEAGSLSDEERAAGEALLDRLLAQSRAKTA